MGSAELSVNIWPLNQAIYNSSETKGALFDHCIKIIKIRYIDSHVCIILGKFKFLNNSDLPIWPLLHLVLHPI